MTATVAEEVVATVVDVAVVEDSAADRAVGSAAAVEDSVADRVVTA